MFNQSLERDAACRRTPLINEKGENEKMKKLRASKASIMVLTLLMLSACGSLRPVDHPPIVQHPYLSKDFIGQEREKPSVNINEENWFLPRPIDKWVGERFIFLPTRKEFQWMGYHLRKDKSPVHDRLDYKKYVGRIANVVSVNKLDMWWNIDLVMEGNLEKIKAKLAPHLDNLDGMAPIEDIIIARNKWLGKTLWYRWGTFCKYDPYAGKQEFIKIKRFSPVKVTSITASDISSFPVRLFLRTDSGEEAFWDITPTGTNVRERSDYKGRFQENFFTENPRVKYPWPDEIWSVIEETGIRLGMTKEQVMMSWGLPKAVHDTITTKSGYSQWVYEGLGRSRTYLYFEGGRLNAIQD